MKAVYVLIFGIAFFCTAEARAQALPMTEVEPGAPAVRDPVILLPAHDPERELVLYRVIDFNLDAADVPFFVDRTGLVIPRAEADAAIGRLLLEERTAVYACASRPGERPDIARPAERSRFCTLERQP